MGWEGSFFDWSVSPKSPALAPFALFSPTLVISLLSLSFRYISCPCHYLMNIYTIIALIFNIAVDILLAYLLFTIYLSLSSSLFSRYINFCNGGVDGDL